MELVFATNNAHKLKEVRQMMSDSGLDIKVLSLSDIGCSAEIPEDSDTFRGNALQKATYIRNNFHRNCFADDSGLMVDALGGEPGVHTARYAGNHDSEANMAKLLSNLKDSDNRNACFVTSIALITDGGTNFFDGVVKGTIATEKHGEGGFGYDPIFIPHGFDETFAQLGDEIKNGISHRYKAVTEMIRFLKNI